MTRPMVRRVVQVMGMPVSLAVRDAPDAAVDLAWSHAVTDLRWIDGVLSTWRPDSPMSRLARGEVELDDCPPEIAEVLAIGARAEGDSGGAFSVRLPAAYAGPGIGRTQGRGRVLDPTGVVKGWAVQRAARRLLHLGDVCLAAGGDLVCAAPSGEPWRIGVEDPRSPDRVLAIVPVTHGAVATSGSAHRGAHVVDARTGQPATHWASVTVVAHDLVVADVAATTALALGPDADAWLTARGHTAVLVPAYGDARVLAA